MSHAVGCAFAICLEKKQQRDRLCAVSMSVDASTSAFTRHGSFRQTSITERLADPQGVKPAPPEATASSTEVASAEANPHAVARPHATDLMLARQTSFRGFGQLNAANSPFKRQLSLRISELPSTLERQQQQQQQQPAAAADNNNGVVSPSAAVEASAVGAGEAANAAAAPAGGVDNAGLDSVLMPRLAAAHGDTGWTKGLAFLFK